MAKLDYKKMAAGLKLSSEKEPDGDEPKGPIEDDGDDALGEKLCAAVDSKNYPAIVEAVRAIKG
jgi:hypothetical protein